MAEGLLSFPGGEVRRVGMTGGSTGLTRLKRSLREWGWVLRGVRRLGTSPRVFPPPESARADGILAVGGDLSPERLLEAYRRGLYPWYGPGHPILWHCPEPRHVLELARLRIPRDIRRVVRQGRFEVRMDTAFEQVVRAAASVKRKRGGSWLSEEVISAYVELHRRGYAHCAEAWVDGELRAGLYGVALGRAWFGESMFTQVSQGGNVVFALFAERLKSWGFAFLDGQVHSPHVARFGQEPWPRARFLSALDEALSTPDPVGRWSMEADSPFPPTEAAAQG